MSIGGNTRLAGVFGWPVSHSRSPLMHNFWLAEHGIDGVYLPLAVRPDDFKDALHCLPKLGFAGANVTVPHKEAALACVDIADENARRIGAVNTVRVGDSGELIGSNTDGYGFLANLAESQAEWRHAEVGVTTVLGAGGAARAVVVALLDAGVPELRLVNRSAERAHKLANDIGDERIRIVAWHDRSQALSDAALLVNTTAAGLEGEDSLALDLEALPQSAIVTDLVYQPLITPLLRSAHDRGNPIVDGLGMLIHQARPGFLAWFGVEPTPGPALRRLLERDLAGDQG